MNNLYYRSDETKIDLNVQIVNAQSNFGSFNCFRDIGTFDINIWLISKKWNTFFICEYILKI